MAIKADIEALKDSVRARINDNEEQDITAADVRESVIDTIDTLHEETERDFQKKEAGKGLSKNDYTDEDKEKVDGSIQKIIHNGEAVPVVDGTTRLNTVTTSDVDAKINYAIKNEAKERQAMDTRFRQEIGEPNALETEAKQLVPAINEVLRKSGGDSYTKVEADERFATKEELEATHVLIPYIDEYSTDAELSAALDIIRGAEEGANMLCETEMFSGRYAVVTSLKTNPMGASFRYISEEEYIKKQIDRAPLGAGRRQYICSVTVTPIGGGAPVDAYTKEETDELLSGKQPTITDLAIIRSGASAGATAVQPTALNSYAKKEDVDKIVITLPTIDEGSMQFLLEFAYDKVVAHPNAVFRFNNGFLATAFVDDLNQVNLQYREGNEVVQMVIADNVGTYVLARDVVALADADDVVDIETDQTVKGEKTFQNGLVSDFANISDGKGHTLKSELTALQLKVSEKAKVTPTLTSGTQIATITTENAQGQAVETPLYAPQGGGSSLPLSVVDGKLCVTFNE